MAGTGRIGGGGSAWWNITKMNKKTTSGVDKKPEKSLKVKVKGVKKVYTFPASGKKFTAVTVTWT